MYYRRRLRQRLAEHVKDTDISPYDQLYSAIGSGLNSANEKQGFLSAGSTSTSDWPSYVSPLLGPGPASGDLPNSPPWNRDSHGHIDDPVIGVRAGKLLSQICIHNCSNEA